MMVDPLPPFSHHNNPNDPNPNSRYLPRLPPPPSSASTSSSTSSSPALPPLFRSPYIQPPLDHLSSTPAPPSAGALYSGPPPAHTQHPLPHSHTHSSHTLHPHHLGPPVSTSPLQSPFSPSSPQYGAPAYVSAPYGASQLQQQQIQQQTQLQPMTQTPPGLVPPLHHAHHHSSPTLSAHLPPLRLQHGPPEFYAPPPSTGLPMTGPHHPMTAAAVVAAQQQQHQHQISQHQNPHQVAAAQVAATLADVTAHRPPKEIKRRTKTGCLTCRKRRIKCDERHPMCFNCAKSKRVCLGYDPVFKTQRIVSAAAAAAAGVPTGPIVTSTSTASSSPASSSPIVPGPIALHHQQHPQLHLTQPQHLQHQPLPQHQQISLSPTGLGPQLYSLAAPVDGHQSMSIPPSHSSTAMDPARPSPAQPATSPSSSSSPHSKPEVKRIKIDSLLSK
ncbi:uncharacterized protein V1516DRAFT_679602 [Lipomyces oligophaga]|uniref:uncharacterized protein n=1 Tax=Lipomyces oligophaga TaxID=45792 RepID=UPI0034CD1E3E